VTELLLLDVQQSTPPKSGETCGKCANAVRPHNYRPDWIYCRKRPCKRTQYGIMKVRSRQAACELFEQTPPRAAAGEGEGK